MTAEDVLLVLVLAAGSLLYLAAGRRLLRPAPGRLGAALAGTLEWLGLTVIAWAGNVALYAAAVAVVRVSGGFVSIYPGTDAMLLLVAAVQAQVLVSLRK